MDMSAKLAIEKRLLHFFEITFLNNRKGSSLFNTQKKSNKLGL